MKCQVQGCDNDARYTTAAGPRTCSLCAMRSGHAAVRDIDLPAVLAATESLLDELDAQLASVGTSTRTRLRVLLGVKPIKYRGEF